MERNKKIQLGVLALAVTLLVGTLIGGGFDRWFGKSEADEIRSSAANVAPDRVNPAGFATYTNPDGTSRPADGKVGQGNIPGTNLNNKPLPEGPTTMIKYDNDRFDFGSTDEGQIIEHTYRFTNIGKEDLVIINCQGSCGCTVPTWPKEPIPPGGKGEIKVSFNTKGKPGQQTKRVTVTANTVPTETFLEIRGEVRGKAGFNAKSGK